IDLTLIRAEIVLVAGGNGCGKTTLAKVLAGLYPPASGSILVNGRTATSANSESYSELFSVIFHDFHILQHIPTGDKRFEKLLRRFKLDGKMRAANGASSLSLGESKRLALALAYVDDKPITILDEPAADQEPAFQEIFCEEILRELRDRGKLVVVMSHDDR